MKILLFSPVDNGPKVCCFGVQVNNQVYGVTIDLEWEREKNGTQDRPPF